MFQGSEGFSYTTGKRLIISPENNYADFSAE